MIQPRYSKLRPASIGSEIHRNLPTGKSFSGSNLDPLQSAEIVFSIVSDVVLIADYPEAGWTEPRSPLIVEAGKIVVCAIWFWCLIGADFCADSVNTVITYCIQDI